MMNLSLCLFFVLLARQPSCSVGGWTKKEAIEKTAGATEAIEKAVTTESSKEKEGIVRGDYGVDISFPMHHREISTNYAWLKHNRELNAVTPSEYENMALQPLGNREAFYQDFIEGCIKANGAMGSRCVASEQDRVAMTLRQPQSMTNYTKDGFKKIKTPASVWKLIYDFWEKNKDGKLEKKETWGTANTYTNNWKAPTYMVSVEDTSLRGAGHVLKQAIWDSARETIQEWTGEELTQCSLYGIRIYTEGSILSSHVDRLPLVSSAIINVASDLDEPWPLEVIAHDGRAWNITMEPGDMVLYESHSVIHGRPYPLKGRFVANLFIHFEPTGHTLRHHNVENEIFDVDRQYRESLKKGVSGHEHHEKGLPSYIEAGSPEARKWHREHDSGDFNGDSDDSEEEFTTGSRPAHYAAAEGDLDGLREIISDQKGEVHEKDENGWTPLHEGAIAGHDHIVKYLIDQGADVNAKTGVGGEGGTVLWWARQELEEGHPVLELLESFGAIEAGPDL